MRCTKHDVKDLLFYNSSGENQLISSVHLKHVSCVVLSSSANIFSDVNCFVAGGKRAKRQGFLRSSLFVVWEQTHPLFICIIILHRHQATNDIAFRSNLSFYSSQVETQTVFCSCVDGVMAGKKITLLQYVSARTPFSLDLNSALKL